MSVLVTDRPLQPPGSRLLDLLKAKPLLPAYRTGMECPGCGAWAWNVGRVSASCQQCGTVLPLPVAGMVGPGVYARNGKR
jgi:hypothetical protein